MIKRVLSAAIPVLTAAVLVAGAASATTAKKVSCHQIRAELQAGKNKADVAKDLKVSTKEIDRCSAKVASNKKHVHGMSSGSQAAPPTH